MNGLTQVPLGLIGTDEGKQEMKKNTNMVSLVVIGAGIIVAIATGMQSRNANAIPEVIGAGIIVAIATGFDHRKRKCTGYGRTGKG